MKKLKKGDQVIVIAGRSKGLTGSIKHIEGNRVKIEDVNLVKKHVKPNPQKGIEGGIISRLAWLDISISI